MTKHYYLSSLDAYDSFTRNTIGNDLDLSDLKEIAQSRESFEINWDDKFCNDCIYGYSNYEDDEYRTERYCISCS